MKKYLFLFTIFFVLFFLKPYLDKKTKYVSYQSVNNIGYNNYKITFKNGINSTKLGEKINGYSGYYVINKINDVNVKCMKYDICIKQIFDIEDDYFGEKYIASGFIINSITIIADSSITNDFLKENSLIYEVY